MEKAQRLISLDVLRGITIAGMIIVNNPGSWKQCLHTIDACCMERTNTDRFGVSFFHVHNGYLNLYITQKILFFI